MRVGIEAQRVFRRNKHGMDIAILEIIRQIQELDKTNQYYIFVKPDVDHAVLKDTENVKIIHLKMPTFFYGSNWHCLGLQEN